jgi:ubiquinone/menaquinone biosynthesis C-methylase UbiE
MTNKIRWIGIDKSEDMIKEAWQKDLDADLIIADVINMPLEDNSVNYIKNRFAFHHYAVLPGHSAARRPSV